MLLLFVMDIIMNQDFQTTLGNFQVNLYILIIIKKLNLSEIKEFWSLGAVILLVM